MGGGRTLLLKHFRNNLLNIYSIGLNRAEPIVAEPAFITTEDGNEPRLSRPKPWTNIKDQLTAGGREGLKLKASQ